MYHSFRLLKGTHLKHKNMAQHEMGHIKTGPGRDSPRVPKKCAGRDTECPGISSPGHIGPQWNAIWDTNRGPSPSPSPVQFSEVKFEAIISKRSVRRARSNEPHFFVPSDFQSNESWNLNLPYSPRLFSFLRYI